MHGPAAVGPVLVAAGRGRAAGRAGEEATIDPDDLTIHFPAHGGVLTDFHGVEFEEQDSYVVGRPATSERPVEPGRGVPLVGIRRIVTGRLDRPLGGRVLLTTWGQPLMVTPSEG